MTKHWDQHDPPHKDDILFILIIILILILIGAIT